MDHPLCVSHHHQGCQMNAKNVYYTLDIFLS